jgi:hypothetical protein
MKDEDITDQSEASILGNFIFHHECKSWCRVYVVALKCLGEDAKDQWTHYDVIDAVMRCEKTTHDSIIKAVD